MARATSEEIEMGTSRLRGHRVKVATAIGLAAFIGMGTLAAAAADQPSTDGAPANPAVPPADQDAAEPSPVAVDEPPMVAEPPEHDDIAPPAADPSGVCLTHGQRVSEIARATPPGAGHGAAVSAAAHDHTGECARGDESADEPESAPPTTAHPSTVQPAPPGPAVAPPDSDRSITQQGHGHGNGDGHAKG
jgi:hypothetical protein